MNWEKDSLSSLYSSEHVLSVIEIIVTRGILSWYVRMPLPDSFNWQRD
jgi:hypothetical protein